MGQEKKKKDITLENNNYEYNELLSRIYSLISKNNPEMNPGEREQVKIQLPHVARIGTKKTLITNFNDISKSLHRYPEHIKDFMLCELGTTGSFNDKSQLVIRGVFKQTQIESIIKIYCKEYVICHECNSPNTILQKDIRLTFLQCDKCKSRYTVASIKSGFQAITSNRRHMRYKTVVQPPLQF